MAGKRLTKRPVCFDERSGRLLDDRYEFVVTPPAGRASLSIGGVVVMAGQRLDKRLVDPRRLRQMYEARLIVVVPETFQPAERKVRSRAIGPADTSLEQPPSENHSRVVPRRRLSRAA